LQGDRLPHLAIKIILSMSDSSLSSNENSKRVSLLPKIALPNTNSRVPHTIEDKDNEILLNVLI
jgi:hypothetical protein